MHKVLIFPQDNNPYQNLLYGSLRQLGIRSDYIKYTFNSHTLRFIELPYRLFKYRQDGYDIFHLHWLYSFKFPINHWLFNNALSRFFFTSYFIFMISLVKLLKYKLVWTIHNTMPHEAIFINDHLVCKWLSYKSDRVIAHSTNTLSEIKKLCYETDNVYVIPHGNYIKTYDTNMDKIKARKLLGLDKNKKILLFFGKIRRYKGVLELIETYKRINRIDIMLIIIGECVDNVLLAEIHNKITNDIVCILKHMNNKKLSMYISACDIVLLPYKKITSSGSAILAMSFGKTFIAPEIGDFVDLPNDVGLLYDPNDIDGFYNLLIKSIDDTNLINEKGRKALEYIKKFTWENTARLTINAYLD